VSAAKQSPSIKRTNSRLSNVSKQGEKKLTCCVARALFATGSVLTFHCVSIRVSEQAQETSPSQTGKAAQPQSPLCRAVLTTQSQQQQRAHQACSCNRLHQLQQMPALTAGPTSPQQVAPSQAGLLHSALSCRPAQESRQQQQQERLSRQWAAWEAGQSVVQEAASIRWQVSMAHTVAACLPMRSCCSFCSAVLQHTTQEVVPAHPVCCP
jgi:hypothetical protein